MQKSGLNDRTKMRRQDAQGETERELLYCSLLPPKDGEKSLLVEGGL
jgi:hypothetical protein